MLKKLFRPGTPSPENAAHNHDFDADDAQALAQALPQRDVSEADFGAEYHGFTGFERAGKGSDYSQQ